MITPGTDRLGYFGLQEGVERQNRAPPRSGLVQHLCLRRTRLGTPPEPLRASTRMYRRRRGVSMKKEYIDGMKSGAMLGKS
jgi:hypothetical protein